ncbi:MAG: YjbQ family protein [Anaerolineae bacterium]|nr:YjbQ family protein [Anaerolineae bacterium]
MERGRRGASAPSGGEVNQGARAVPLPDTFLHAPNGHSHVRAALLGPSLTVPFSDRRLTLGTWQRVVYVDFDTRLRQRRLAVQMIGD